MIKLTPIERLLLGAERHKRDYPAFDLVRFMAEVLAQGDGYVRWAARNPITTVTRSIRDRRKAYSFSQKELDR